MLQRRKIGRPSISDAALLDVAGELFLEHGFDRTSIDAIAAAAGMAKRTLYARHGDKEALFRAALQHAIGKWIVPVDRLRRLETGSLDETLPKVAEVLVANIMNPVGRRLFRLTNAMAGRMPDIAVSNVEQGTEPTIAYLADLFARYVDFGTVERFTPREAAQAFLQLVVGGPSTMAAWGGRVEDADIARHIQSSIDLFLHGLQSGPSQAQVVEQNARLRRMLTDALLENAALKEARA